jgi:hypothetical protein
LPNRFYNCSFAGQGQKAGNCSSAGAVQGDEHRAAQSEPGPAGDGAQEDIVGMVGGRVAGQGQKATGRLVPSLLRQVARLLRHGQRPHHSHRALPRDAQSHARKRFLFLNPRKELNKFVEFARSSDCHVFVRGAECGRAELRQGRGDHHHLPRGGRVNCRA